MLEHLEKQHRDLDSTLTRSTALRTRCGALCPEHGVIENVVDVFPNGTMQLKCGVRRSLAGRKGRSNGFGKSD